MKKFLCISILCSVLVASTPALAAPSDVPESPLQTAARTLEQVLGPNVVSLILRQLGTPQAHARPTERIGQKEKAVRPTKSSLGCTLSPARTPRAGLAALVSLTLCGMVVRRRRAHG